jgi:hypothetical protein
MHARSPRTSADASRRVNASSGAQNKTRYSGRTRKRHDTDVETDTCIDSLLRSRGLQIKLADDSLLPELLAFLRSEGCVAYYGGGTEAVRPRSLGVQEAKELRLAVNRWRNEHPDAQIELSD